MEKIAIFVSYGFGLAPIDCPEEYSKSDFTNRKKFAEWLELNGQKYLIKETSKSAIYQYRYGQFEGCVAIVPVDTTRPWLIHFYDGKERIWYLDKYIDMVNNQVRPDVQTVKGCAGFCMDSCVEEKCR